MRGEVICAEAISNIGCYLHVVFLRTRAVDTQMHRPPPFQIFVLMVMLRSEVDGIRAPTPCPPPIAPAHCSAAHKAITCHRVADPLPLLQNGKGEVKPESIRSITLCLYPEEVIDLGPIIKEFPDLRRLTVAPGGMVSKVVGFDLEDEAGASSSSSSSEEAAGGVGQPAGGGSPGEEERWAALLRKSASSNDIGNLSALFGEPLTEDEKHRLQRILRKRRLRILDLSGNRLRTLEAGRWIRRVHKIYLAANPWNCSDGALRWLVADKDQALPSRLGRRIADRDKMACSEDSFPGKPLFQVMALTKHLYDQCPDGHPWHCSCHMHNVVWHSGGEGGLRPGGRSKRPDWLVPMITVDCSNRNLTKLPSRLPDNTTTLSVKGNKISDVRPLATNEDYRDVRDVYLDDNEVTSIDVLEGSYWLLNFRLLSLRGNQISKLPVYAIDAAIESNSRAWGIYLGMNPWDCACSSAPALRDFLAKYGSTVARDVQDVRCAFAEGDDLSLEPVVELSRSEVCLEGGDGWADWVHGDWSDIPIEPLDVINVIMLLLIIFILSKLAYDCFIYRRTGRLPWIVTKLP